MARRPAALVALALAVLAPAAPAAAAPERHYVAKLKGSNAFVALVKKGGSVRAYVCDGRPKLTTLSVWFQGRIREGRVDLDAAGLNVAAAIRPPVARGSVTLTDGRELSFRATRVGRRGGLLETTTKHRGRSYHSGWILLPDRRVRGRTLISGTSLDGTTSVGPGIDTSTAPNPPSDANVLIEECKRLARDLSALQDLLSYLQAQKPVRPGKEATDDQLAVYAAQLSRWQASVADTQRKIELVKTRIDRTCGPKG